LTRIVFVEGIIGAGKSTCAAGLVADLEAQGSAALIMREGGPLRVGTHLSNGFTPWQEVSPEEYVRRCVELWREYAAEIERQDTTIVCDGLFFHGNMSDLLLMDASSPVFDAYVDRVGVAVAALRPRLVQLRADNVRHVLRAICDERGPSWERYQLDCKLSSPYATRRSLTGFDGLVRLYEDYAKICDDIVSRLPFPVLRVPSARDKPPDRSVIAMFVTT
jgi:hypothetical protein